MRSALSLSIASALLVTAPLATAIPTRVPRDAPPPVESQAVSPSSGATTIRLHRRGSAELMQEDGSIDFGKSHAHLARARAKYVRGLRNFELNTGEAHFLSPGLVDPSLLPTPGGEALVRRDAWGNGEEDSLDWAGDAAPELEKRGDVKVFGAGARLHGVPPPSPAGSAGPVANKRALAKRAVKNPKAVWNPKAHAASTTSSAAAAKKTGGVALTDYDGTLYTGVMSIGTPAKEFIIDFDTGSADLWVPSSSCNSAACNPHTKYDASGSSTSKAVAGKSLSITYGDGSSTRGTVYTDTVTLSGLTASGQTLGAATSLSSDFQDDPYDGLMGMAYQSISTLGASPLFQTLVAQDKVANSQFSFYLAEDGSELFLGGMNPALYKAGSTRAYPVVSQSYWLLATQANVAGKPVSAVGTFNSIVDTGTSVIVVRYSSPHSLLWLATDVSLPSRRLPLKPPRSSGPQSPTRASTARGTTPSPARPRPRSRSRSAPRSASSGPSQASRSTLARSRPAATAASARSSARILASTRGSWALPSLRTSTARLTCRRTASRSRTSHEAAPSPVVRSLVRPRTPQ